MGLGAAVICALKTLEGNGAARDSWRTGYFPRDAGNAYMFILIGTLGFSL